MQEIWNLHAQSSWVSVTAQPHRQTTLTSAWPPAPTAGEIHSDRHKDTIRVFWYRASGICTFFARPAEETTLSTSVLGLPHRSPGPHPSMASHTRCFLPSGFCVGGQGCIASSAIHGSAHRKRGAGSSLKRTCPTMENVAARNSQRDNLRRKTSRQAREDRTAPRAFDHPCHEWIPAGLTGT